MFSTITLTAFDKNTSSYDRKAAKMSPSKVTNIKSKYHLPTNDVKQEVKQESLAKTGIKNYKRVLDLYNMGVLDNGNNAFVKANGARKLKVNQIVRDGTSITQREALKDGIAIKNDTFVESKTINNDSLSFNNTNDNIVEFPKINKPVAPKMAPYEEVSRVEPVREVPFTTSEATATVTPSVNNVVEFPKTRVAMEPNNQSHFTNDNNLSRVSRIDYTSSMNDMSDHDRVNGRDNGVSIDDYLQQTASGINDKDIAELVQKNEKLDNEIVRNQSILENLEAELKKIQVIREEKRKAQINALEEEEFSKTATLKGLTEQIRSLQEAIRQEQQNLNDTASYRREAPKQEVQEPYSYRRAA